MSTFAEQGLKEVDKYDATCPSCIASIKFAYANSTLTCPYCGYEKIIPQPELDEERYSIGLEDG